MHQNVTLKLDKELLRKAKVFATREGTSLSRLMVEALKSFIKRIEGYSSAQRKALQYLNKGLKLGGGSYYLSRENLHHRHG